MHALSSTKHIAGALLALGLAASAMPSYAVQKGDLLIRAGVGHVAPNDSSSGFSGAPSLEVEEVGSSTNLAINFTYMVSDNIGVELLGALPFKHDIKVTGLDKVVETKQLPPTVILLYNFAPKSTVRPYAGGESITPNSSRKKPRARWTVPALISIARPDWRWKRAWTWLSTRNGSLMLRCGASTSIPRQDHHLSERLM